MPRDFPNPPIDSTESRRRYLGQGREVIAFSDDTNEENILAYYKNGDIFEKNRNALITLYQTLFIHKILHLLYPQNFPKWKDAGLNKDGYVASVREKIVGILKEKGASVELKRIVELFKKYNLNLGLDLARPNVFFHENIERYVDSANIFINGHSDLEKLESLMGENGISSELQSEVIRIVRRIILLQKFKK